MTKAIVLLSGGLDSMLAVKLLQEQGIDVLGLCFQSNFYGSQKARVAAENLGVELRVVDFHDQMLKLVKNPPSGYGKNLNPCVDCHASMIKTAGEIGKKEGFAFVATGEVLGQRPFSQNKESLQRVRNLSGIDVLRPLSAKYLPETEVEASGLIRRGMLEGIRGRSRERQFELAVKFKLKDVPLPAGGCLLTDPVFSDRLGKMLDFWPDCEQADIELLKFGRVFWFNVQKNGENKKKKRLVIIGRDHSENLSLEKLAKEGDFMVKLKDINGPAALVRFKDEKTDFESKEYDIEIPSKLDLAGLRLGQIFKEDIFWETVCRLTGLYSSKARGEKNIIVVNKIVSNNQA